MEVPDSHFPAMDLFTCHHVLALSRARFAARFAPALSDVTKGRFRTQILGLRGPARVSKWLRTQLLRIVGPLVVLVSIQSK